MNNKVQGIVILIITVVLLALLLLPSELQAQAQNGFAEPSLGDVVSGIVIVEGTAIHPDFLRYEIAFFQEARPGNEWIVFAQGDQPVIEGTLAVWDTTVGSETAPVFPDGRYRLRLRVVRNDYNYDEFFVTDLFINNGSLTPSATPALTLTLQVNTVTPLAGTALAATLQASTGILPSLTPFPTPSPLATPENSLLGPGTSGGESSDGEEQGLLKRLSAIDLGRIGNAFWLGVLVVAIAFVALGGYFLLRGLIRWLWRRIQLRRYR